MLNWSLGTVPVASSAVLFNSGNVSDSSIDALFGGTIRRLRIDSGYTGTLTQSAGLIITGDYAQSGGSFVSDHTQGLSWGGVSLAGGTFNRYTGSGTVGDPYMVYDVYGLQGMSLGLEAVYRLAGDIDASGTASWNSGAGFIPAGYDWTNSFSGTFDGDGHTIADLTINRPATNDVGLFGYAKGGTIRDVGLVDVDITGFNYVGGLVGYARDSSIDNSYATGNVSGSNNVGGLVGYARYSSIDNSYAAGNVNGSNTVGGLVGKLGYYSNVHNSYAIVSVSGDDRVGGLVGDAWGCSMDNSYAAGSVSGSNHVGGLVGYNRNSSMDNSYAAGEVSSSDVGGLIGFYSSGTLTNNWWYNDTSDYGIFNTGDVGNKASAASDFYDPAFDVYTGAGPWDFDFDWIADPDPGGSYPTIGLNPATNIWDDAGSGLWSDVLNWTLGTVPIASSAVLFNSGNVSDSSIDALFGGTIRKLRIDSGYTGTLTQDRPLVISVSYDQRDGTYIAADPVTDAFSAVDFTLSGGTFDRFTGAGTGEDPYLVRDIYDLQAMRGFLSSTFRLNEDIAAVSTSDWDAGAGFAPVGDGGDNFSGTFDGDGHTITGLTINRPATNYVGLFGYTSGATIRDVGLVDVDIVGLESVGGLVGGNNSSNIHNSSVTGSVSGRSYIGGLIGSNSSSNISDSYADVSVSGSASSVGGLVGSSSSSSTILNSYATGDVSGDNRVGGLVGYSNDSSIDNSYAAGSVNGINDYIGGLVGYARYSSIDNSYAIGDVSGSSGFVGGLVGRSSSSSTILNSYATGDVSGDNKVGGLVGYNSSSIDNSYATGVATATGEGQTPGGLVGGVNNGVLTNNWWYSANTYGVGSDLDNPVIEGQYEKAAGVSDFYDPTFDVYTGAVPWDFDFDWIAHPDPGGSYPTLGVSATTNIWDDAGSGLWSDVLNWSLGTVPVASSAVLFNSGNVSDSSIDALFGGTIRKLRIDSGYTGTLTQERSLAITDDYTQSGGTFNQNENLTVSRNYAQSAGSFISDRTKDFSAYSFSLTGGSFNRYTGSGTAGDPYMVYDVYGLQGISRGLEAVYKLAGDIDASGTASWNSGAGFIPAGYDFSNSFSGTFDGDGHTITGLTINRPITNYVGLFGYATGATIRDVGLVNLDITGFSFVGGLAGATRYSSIIDNSYTTGNVSGNDMVGGIVGYTRDSSIDNSYAIVNVSGSVMNIGGLVGYNGWSASIHNSYAAGSVSGSSERSGGLVGYNMNSSIDNSYAVGVVSSINMGGLIGYDNSGTLTNNWWYNDTSDYGIFNTGDVGNKASAVSDFYDPAFDVYTGATEWDFENVWIMVSYPKFRYQFDVIWDGSFSSDWSDAANWNTNAVPVATDSVLFGNNNAVDSTIDENFAGQVGNLTVGYTYAGTLTQAKSLAITGDYTQSDGTFIQNDDLAISGNFVQSGGSFVSDPAKELSWGGVSLTGGSFNRYTGSGTAGDPYMVYDVYGLQGMSLGLEAVYRLAGDIDALETASWNSGAGFVPVGYDLDDSFSGTFDGDGHVISDLFIDRSGENYVGLFGYASGATIRNVGLVDVDITGRDYVGGLVGINRASYDHGNSRIENSYAEGAVTGHGGVVGGLIGSNSCDYYHDASIDNSYADVDVVGVSDVGGLVGIHRNDYYGVASISNSYATGSVTGTGGNVGGLVGRNFGGSYGGTSSIDNSYATGTVTGAGNNIGGLVGLNQGGYYEGVASIMNSYATGIVTGTGDNVGGLVGLNEGFSNEEGVASIMNSYAMGTVTGGNQVGGLVGFNFWYASIDNSYAIGDVSGDSNIGGLVGQNGSYFGDATIDNSYAAGFVTGNTNTGGLVGLNDNGTVTDSFWDKTAEGTGQSHSAGSDDSYGKTTAEMQDVATFTDAGWDFDTIWRMPSGHSPVFLWQSLDFTWTGAAGGGDYNWSTAANWSQGITPLATDNVIFSSSYNIESIIDDGFNATNTIKSLTLGAGYTNTITQNASSLTITGDYTQSGGTMALGAPLIVGGDLVVSGGVLDAGDQGGGIGYDITVGGSWTASGGTFNANQNTVTFDGSAIGNTIDGGSSGFYNLVINSAGGTGQWTLANDLQVNHDLTISSGVLDAGDQGGGTGYDITVGGSWDAAGGTFIANGNTVTLSIPVSEERTIDPGSSSFYDLVIDSDPDSDYQLINHDLTVTNTLTITSGSLNANSLGITTGGDWTNLISGGKVTDLGLVTLTGSGTLTESGTFDTLDIAGDYTLADDLAVDGDLVISGSLDADSNGISEGGDWGTVAGAPDISNLGDVTLTGTGQTVYGDNTFANLTKIVTSADTLVFEAGSTQTITGTLTLKGAAGEALTIRSDDTLVQRWDLDAAAVDMEYVTVTDANNVGTAIDLSGKNCTDGGNNEGSWTFTAPAPPVPDNGSSEAAIREAGLGIDATFNALDQIQALEEQLSDEEWFSFFQNVPSGFSEDLWREILLHLNIWRLTFYKDFMDQNPGSENELWKKIIASLKLWSQPPAYAGESSSR